MADAEGGEPDQPSAQVGSAGTDGHHVESDDVPARAVTTPTERLLREIVLRNELTFRHAPIGQALVGLDGSWRQVNEALLRLLEYDEEELLARTFQDITHPEDLDLDLDLLQRTLAGEIESYEMEKRYRTRTGRTVWVLLSVALVRDDSGEPLYFISQIQDITDRKAQVQALQDFTAMLAHDLRTPASVISGFAHLLATGEHDDEVVSMAQRIERASGTLVELLDNALTTEAIDSGRLAPRPSATVMRDVAAEAAATVGAAAESDETPLSIDHAGVPPLLAWVDPVHLLQVLGNLLGNSRKYGGPHAWVTARSMGRHVELLVEDDGPGVPPDFRPSLFERYSRAAEVRGGRHRGSGLGLYIVRDLVEANGGTIEYVDSERGGAGFRILLPSA